MICPKCGRPVDASAVICPGCDFILDTEFLGDEILDEEQSLRPGIGGVDPAVFNLADAVILGDIDEQAQSFETSDSGFHVRESTGARLYVSGRSQAMMAPDAVPAVVDADLDGVRLTPFEKHVLSFIDGKRPVEIIRLRAGLDESEVKTALATLADKGVVEVVGRALVETDPFQETAQRRMQKPRRPSAVAGAVAAALGPLGDETDRAIEEAFRTATGLSPLAASDLAPPPEDDDNVFSSLSGDPLASRELARQAKTSRSQLSDLDDVDDGGDESSLPSDTAFTQRPGDDDLPSDADSFDVLAHTSEIERSPALEERLRAAPPAPAQRGGLEPMATNARRVLSDPELAEILGDDDDDKDDAGQPLPASTRVGERPSGLESAGASDGFDDFGEASELDTAMLPGIDSSLSQGAPDSEVFKSVTGTVSTPVVARPSPAAMEQLRGHQLASGASDESMTGTRPQLADDESASLSELLGDDDAPAFPSLTPAMPAPSASDGSVSEGRVSSEAEANDAPPPLAPDVAASSAAADLGDGGDLADLVGDEPPSTEGTDTSKVGSVVEEPGKDVHSAITAAPALQVPAVDSDESVDPFAGIDLEESSEEEPEAAASEPPQEARRVPVPSADVASSDEGTAVYAQNPFAPDAEDADDDDDEHAVTSTRPMTNEVERVRPSSEVSVVFEVEDDRPSEHAAAVDDDSDAGDAADDFYEAATDGVPAFVAAAALSRGNLADAFSDEEAPGPYDEDDPELEDDEELEAPTARGFEDPRNRPPMVPPDEAAAPAAPAEPSVSSDEELIDDAMIIRPAAPTMQLRGASVLERVSPRATPVSAELSSAHEEVQVSEPAASVPLPPAPSSQVTAHLERPEELAALALAPPAPPSPPSESEETALFSDVGELPSAASELSQGGAWASSDDSDDASAEGSVDGSADYSADSSADYSADYSADASADDDDADASYDDDASDEHAIRGQPSSESTQVLSGPRRAAPPPAVHEASEAPPADVDEAAAPLHTGSRNDPEAMREKARKLFDDALKDFREGRIGAARMNAKLATIYDPANEEYRAALEQWGKGGRRRAPQQVASYAALYDEAQEREGAGDIEGAITLLLQGAEQFPEIAAIQNRLGVLLAIHKREYDRASAYIQRAIELDPENLHYKSNLGKILSRRRQRQKRANG